jgi:hypothetical protein
MIETEEDRRDFAAVLGTAATWSVGPAAVSVIIDNDHAEVSLGLAGVSSRNPRALAVAADMPTVAVGQTLTIAGTVYTIRDVQPDGTGMVALELQAP